MLWQVATAQAWRVEWIEVAGCNLISPEKVVQVSGLAEAWAVAIVPSEVEDSVNSLPGVVSTEVRVAVPNRVRITIEEDRPVALMRTEEGDYWISGRCQVLEPFGMIEGLPVLKLAEGNWNASVVPQETLAGLTALLAAFPGQEEFVYVRGKGYVITAKDGWPVYLGEAEQLQEKLAILGQLERDFHSRGYKPQFLDLRTVAGAYYR